MTTQNVILGSSRSLALAVPTGQKVALVKRKTFRLKVVKMGPMRKVILHFILFLSDELLFPYIVCPTPLALAMLIDRLCAIERYMGRSHDMIIKLAGLKEVCVQTYVPCLYARFPVFNMIVFAHMKLRITGSRHEGS